MKHPHFFVADLVLLGIGERGRNEENAAGAVDELLKQSQGAIAFERGRSRGVEGRQDAVVEHLEHRVEAQVFKPIRIEAYRLRLGFQHHVMHPLIEGCQIDAKHGPAELL